MNTKITGTILGVVGMCLWFMPLAHVNFMGMDGFQTGIHIGGIAYLMLFAFLAYAVLSWLQQPVPRMIAATVAAGVGVLFMVQAGASMAWGLIGVVVTSLVGFVLAVRDHNTTPA